MSSTQCLQSFFYVPEGRPVIVFGTPEEARNFEMSVKGAETYHDPTHVFLPKPHGLELVFASKTGQTAYAFHRKDQAVNWCQKLNGIGELGQDATSERTVYVGQSAHERVGLPIWPGVA